MILGSEGVAIPATPTRVAALAGAVLALLGGVAGALVTVRLVVPRAAAVPSATPTAEVAATSARAAIVERAMPGIVTVLADLPARTDAQGQRIESENIGSGIVIHEAGLVLTNYHVVSGAARLTVVLSTGERRPASYVADDSPFNDMALLRVQGGGLRAVALGDSDALKP
ncbi:MAG: trypsin-like peptidase domain-containing protein, partial [Chloroflexota bacterium]